MLRQALADSICCRFILLLLFYTSLFECTKRGFTAVHCGNCFAMVDVIGSVYVGEEN